MGFHWTVQKTVDSHVGRVKVFLVYQVVRMWTVLGRSWAKVGGSKEKTERFKGRKLDVMKDKSERSKKKKTGRSKVRKLYGHQG